MKSRLPKTLEMLAELIACSSVSSVNPAIDQGNRQVTELLANWLDALGFAVQLLPVNGNQDKLNLVATHGRGDGGLVLAGHTDTVPFDEHSWTADPFKVVERDGRLYGLGTTDMKGFFPLVLEAVTACDLQQLRAPLTILATADEESSMAGARALVASGQSLGRFAVIGGAHRTAAGIHAQRRYVGVSACAWAIGPLEQSSARQQCTGRHAQGDRRVAGLA